MSNILLVAINARYSHASHAARTLLANLGALAADAAILETDLDITPLQIAEQIALRNPRIVGFCVYLWNVRLAEATARILRTALPHARLVAGGPELTPGYANAALFDTVVIGEGETAFRNLCLSPTPPANTVTAAPEPLDALALPFDYYTDTDLAQRTLYAETSRGCPHRCAYCTSAGTKLRTFPLARLLPALERLWQRGARQFKFLDRSFNAPVAHACAVLDFFLPKATPDTRLHFEINPDHLHADILGRIAAFPAGALHLEAGVQTLNPAVAAAIGRSPDTAQTLCNVRRLTRTGAAVHADLIFGLPGEDEASFAQGFDALIETARPPEVQVNILKGLPGTRLLRDAQALGLAFSPEPPYDALRTDAMDFATLCRIQRFARCWELVRNRNRFPQEVAQFHAAIAPGYYRAYSALAARIFSGEGKLFAISQARLAQHLREHLEHGTAPPSVL
ncbi:MAG: radical SAM protein [Kiritimatiellaeota bacterium]|nr:radical SAM protein [Kiritimatiellota bacterium]